MMHRGLSVMMQWGVSIACGGAAARTRQLYEVHSSVSASRDPNGDAAAAGCLPRLLRDQLPLPPSCPPRRSEPSTGPSSARGPIEISSTSANGGWCRLLPPTGATGDGGA